MIWSCNGEIKEIELGYSEINDEYYCCIDEDVYAWEKSADNIGPWDWYREGYTVELAEWVEI